MREDGRRVPAFAECVIRLGLHPLFRLMWRPELINGGRFANFSNPCFVYGNHSHNYDPFIMNMFTPWMDSTAGVLTQEYFRNRFVAWGMHGIDLYPTKKHVTEPNLIRSIYKEINYKRKFLIYPEGGRRWAGRPIPWIESTAKIFAKVGVPIYPVITYGSYVGWPRWAKYPRPAKMKIKVCEPLQFTRKTPIDQVLAALKAPMDFDETMVSDDIKPKWAYKPAVGIHRLIYRDPVSGKNGAVFTPDGTYVQNETGDMRYKMLPDSTLLNEKSGEIVSTATLYEQIRALPLQPNKQGVIIEDRAEMHLELAFPKLIPHGNATFKLYADAVHFEAENFNETIGLQDIVHVGVERSSKLQFFLRDRMIQCNFKGAGSALQWQDTILDMKKQAEATTQQNVTSNPQAS